ncbi:Chitodextrinase [Cohnella sp. OV330]|uniref:fibronectin type III domain-containing protein n=1 Tax=Cohnella sp. OV330 TaxID=1855288 RepID=UPI0008E55E4E|nr:fibronectin type III domain-containing protein [Cohnella sp. OV330]SFA71294.1 Chitodextrinase [Cohnella sp. OV330]
MNYAKAWKVCLIALLTLAAALGGISLAPGQVAAATSFSNVTLNTTAPAEYDKLEIKFDLSSTYANPFNPDEVDVRAYFTTPGGQTEVVPGFYNSNSSPKWAVRYAPRQTGSYSVYLKVTDGSGTGTSSTYTFTAGGPGANRGFMGVSGSRFVDSYGKQLTLIGTNYAWGAPSEILAAMPQYKDAKMNIMRVWYSVWWGNYAPEWGPTVTTQNGITMSYDGVGKYQLENQARLDTLMDTAAANGIYVMLTMNSFGDFYYDWPQNAYNTANGGPSSWSENNTDFWTNPAAIAYQKKLLRYVFARWGYSRALGMLEYWNESDNRVDTDATTRANWHASVDNYWKSLDFYNHPTTTSFAWKDHQEFGQTTWENLTTMNATNYHQYDSASNVIDKWETELKHFNSAFGGRPAFVGEAGISGGGEDPNDASVQRYVHDGLWAPIFRAGAAGGNLWWEFAGNAGFNVPANIKALHAALANFVQPEEQYLIGMPFTDLGAQANSTKAGGYKNADRALLWVNDTQSNYTVGSPRTVTGLSVSLTGMNNGTYDITYFNTVTGTNVSTTTAAASGGTVTLSLPSFTRDIAVKAVRQGSTTPDTTAPSAPANLASPSKTETTVNLTWSASTDNVGVTGYDIYRGGTLIGSMTGAGSTSYTATGLTASTAYSFTVKAKDAAGNVSAASGALSVTTSAPDTQAPTAPTGLTSPSKTDVTVTLSWTASTDNVGVTAYDVYRGSTLAGSTSGTSTTFTDAGLSASTAYSYTVKARDAKGNVSAASSAVSVTTLPPIPANLLANPGFESDGGGQPASWTYEQSFYASRDTSVKRTGNASLKESSTTGPWHGVYQDVNATSGSSYTFDGYINIASNTTTAATVKVQFLNSGGTVLADNTVASYAAGSTTTGFANMHGTYAAPANTAKARVYIYMTDHRGTLYFDDFSLTGGSGGGADTTAPSAPTGLASPSKTSTSVSLSWTASTDNVGVTGYDIYRGTTLAGSTTGATTFTATGLTAGTAYSFTVKAKDAAGNVSAASGALNVTTDAAADTTAPSAPTGLTSPSKTSTSVSLSWTASTDNVGVTGYDIYRGTTLAGSTTGATTFTATGLTASTAYSFTVKAKDAAGNVSAASGALNVTTDAASGGGTNLLANPGFETGNGSGKPATWTCEQDYYCYSDTSVKRSGSTSLRVDGTTSPWFAIYQDVNATAGTAYTMDGYVNITSNAGTRLDFKVQFLNSSGSVISESTAATYNNTTTSGFVNVHGGAYTAPAGTAKVRVYLYITGLNGTFYLDDFSLS